MAPSYPPLRKVFVITGVVALAITVLLWIAASQVLGVFYKVQDHAYKTHVAVVDFDGGAIGQAMLATLAAVNGQDQYPTFVTLDANSTTADAIRQAVYDGDYWAAVIATAGATSRFQAAIAGQASAYDPTNAVVFYTLSARFYSFYQTAVYAPLAALLPTIPSALARTTTGPAIAQGRVATTNQIAISALLAPIVPDHIEVAAFAFGVRALVNTVMVVVQIVPSFFFIMAIHNIHLMMGLFQRLSLRTNMVLRICILLAFAILSGLNVAGYFAAFREEQTVLGATFIGVWAVNSVFSLINLMFFDSLICTLPLPAVPFIFLPYMMWSLAAALAAPGASNNWFNIDYSLPSLHWFTVIIVLLTHGALSSSLRWALPSLGLFVIVGLGIWTFAHLRFFRKLNSNQPVPAAGADAGAEMAADGEGSERPASHKGE